MLARTLALALPLAATAEPTGMLRTDGVPVKLMEPGALEAELELHSRSTVPFKPFSPEFVKHALATGVDWREKGAVTPAKDQGAHGYCGTFGRTCAFEGQYAIKSGHGLRNFSEEQLVQKMAAVQQSALNLTSETLEAEEQEISRRLPLSHWTTEEKDAMQRRLNEIKLKRKQADLARLDQEQKELERQLTKAAGSSRAGINSHWTPEELAAMTKRLAQLQQEVQPEQQQRQPEQQQQWHHQHQEFTAKDLEVWDRVKEQSQKMQAWNEQRDDYKRGGSALFPEWQSSRHAVCGWTVGHHRSKAHPVGKRLGMKWLVGAETPLQHNFSPRPPQPQSSVSARGMRGARQGPPRVAGWVPSWMGPLGYSHSIFGQYSTVVSPGREHISERVAVLKTRPDGTEEQSRLLGNTGGLGFKSVRLPKVNHFDGSMSQHTMPAFSPRALSRRGKRTTRVAAKTTGTHML